MSEGRASWLPVVALGLVTITAFGSWFYGFGVLVGPITDDEGWSTTALGLTYGAAQVLTGVGSFAAGRLLDRFGGRGPFGVQAVFGGGLLLIATWAEDVWSFAIPYAIGAGIIGATGFYSVTTVAAARQRPDQPDRAIAMLTVLGALCSPIVLPLSAWMVSTWDWRLAARVLALMAIGGAVLAALVAGGGASPGRGASPQPRSALAGAMRSPGVRRMLAVYFAAGVAFTSVLAYQVPVMTEAGIALGAAGAIAGFRGFCQIIGRAGLTGAIDRFGSRALLQLAYAISAVGVALLLVGELATALLFSVLAGAGLGAVTPLQAIYARTQFEAADLGLLMGLQGAAIGVAGGVGPVVGGIVHDSSGRWSPVVVLAVVALVVAAAGMRADRPVTSRVDAVESP